MSGWRIAAILFCCAVPAAALCATTEAQIRNDGASFSESTVGGADESDPGIDWSQRKATQLDILFQSEGRLNHGQPGTSREEIAAYLELIANIRFKQQAPGTIFSEVGRSRYENEFYGVPALRERLFDAAQERAASQQRTPGASGALRAYRFADDLAQNPEFFVGRPLVLFGTMKFIGQTSISGALTVSDPGSASGTRTVPVDYPLNRGQLVDPSTGQVLATVDARRYRLQAETSQVADAWPYDASKQVPVIVKGWFVKLWGSVPLMYCEDVQLLGPAPRRGLIEQTTIDLKPLLPEESWLYYETLHQLERTSHEYRRKKAAQNVLLRIDGLMDDLQRELESRVSEADAWLAENPDRESEHDLRVRALNRAMQQRVARYAEYREDPETFYTFNDLFNHPQEWKGRCVTLRGHVRRPTEFDADPRFLGPRKLYELSLFTDDSQSNPAIIVTTSLPEFFPLSEQRVEAVTVTGVYFKHYVYQASSERRIAPLILAEKIAWNPSADYLQQLVEDGVLSEESAIAASLPEDSSDFLARTAVVLLLFLAFLVAMYLRGRQQRDQRGRDRLRHLTASGVSPAGPLESPAQLRKLELEPPAPGHDDLHSTEEER